MLSFIIFFLFSLISLISCQYIFNVNVPLRIQWNEGTGYCGEVSTICTGLFYGQYLSQYDVRDISSKYYKVNTNPQENTQYLVGENDEYTANALRLQYEEYNHKDNDVKDYLAWVKKYTRLGYPVTICVYMNYYLFYGISLKDAGDPDYDHIVSVTTILSNYDDDNYHDSDILIFSDHALWSPNPNNPQYQFNYTFASIQGNREDANTRNGNIYTISNDKTIGNYGIVHLGPMDNDKSLYPIYLSVNYNYESPEIAARSETRPKPMNLILIGTVYNLEIGLNYTIYRYNNENNVPTSNFNTNANLAFSKITIVNNDANVYRFSEQVLSSDKVFYRCVRSDAK